MFKKKHLGPPREMLRTLLVLLLPVTAVLGVDECTTTLGDHVDPSAHDACLVLRAGRMQMYYTIGPDALSICLEGRTSGWLGIGWGRRTGDDFDLAWVTAGGQAVAGDFGRHTNCIGDAGDALNPTNTVVSGVEAAGVTSVCFSRPLDKGDAGELVDTTQPVRLVWAIGPNGDDPVDIGGGIWLAEEHVDYGRVSGLDLAAPATSGTADDGGGGGTGIGPAAVTRPSDGTAAVVLAVIAAVAGVVLIGGLIYRSMNSTPQPLPPPQALRRRRRP